jgi:hypothetical protein
MSVVGIIIELQQRKVKMEDYWSDVEIALHYGKGIAFDGCHKIYVLQDEKQIGLMREYEYEFVLTKEDHREDQLNTLLKKWYAESCVLKFIQSVSSVADGEDENDGFDTLIPQGAEQEEDECELCFSACGDTCEDYDDEEDD